MRREGTPAWMQVVDGVGNRPSRMPVAVQTRLYNLGRWFQTRLYHGSVFGEFSRTAERAERPASMQAWIPAFAGMTTK